MARFRRSSRSSRRSSGSRFSTRRRSNRPTRSRRYTVRRRRGRVGIRAEVKYVNSYRLRVRSVFPAEGDVDFGPLFLPWIIAANEPHTYGIHVLDTPSKDIGDSMLRVAQMSTYGMLLTHCTQGFQGQRRVGLAINPRSLIIRLNVTAGMRMSLTAAAANIGGDAEAGIPQADLDSRQRLNNTQSGVYVRTAIRFVVFRNMEPGTASGTAFNEDTVWQHLFQTGPANPPSVSDFLSPNQVGRYHVVNDFTVNLDHDTPQKNLSIRVPVAKVLRYGGAEANNVRAGHYFLMACAESNLGFIAADIAAPTYVPPVVLYQHRMAYTDS